MGAPRRAARILTEVCRDIDAFLEPTGLELSGRGETAVDAAGAKEDALAAAPAQAIPPFFFIWFCRNNLTGRD